MWETSNRTFVFVYFKELPESVCVCVCVFVCVCVCLPWCVSQCVYMSLWFWYLQTGYLSGLDIYPIFIVMHSFYSHTLQWIWIKHRSENCISVVSYMGFFAVSLLPSVPLGISPSARTPGLAGRGIWPMVWQRWSNIWATRQRSTNWEGERARVAGRGVKGCTQKHAIERTLWIVLMSIFSATGDVRQICNLV